MHNAQWISVDDRLPEWNQLLINPFEFRSDPVIVWSTSKGFHKAKLRKEAQKEGAISRFKYISNNFDIPDVTHWMIPENPNA